MGTTPYLAISHLTAAAVLGPSHWLGQRAVQFPVVNRRVFIAFWLAPFAALPGRPLFAYIFMGLPRRERPSPSKIDNFVPADSTLANFRGLHNKH